MVLWIARFLLVQGTVRARGVRMVRALGFAAAVLIGLSVAGSAQVQTPVKSKALARQPISDAQIHELSQSLQARTASEALTLNPKSLHAAANVQAAPVNVAGAKIVPAPAGAVSPAPVPAGAGANASRVEVVATTPREETLLKGAIAAQGALKPALNVANSSLITIPGIVRMASSTGQELQLKPFILVNQPLQQIASGEFEGELLIGVSEIVDTGITRSLPTPLLFDIAGAVRSDPERVIVDTTSPPFRHVKVVVDALQNQAAKLRVISIIDRTGTEITLPLAGELSIDPESGSIEGWGLETTRVHVATTAVPNPAGRMVSLRVDPSGYLDKGVLPLDSTGMAETVLRSDGIGATAIRASSPELKTAVSHIYFRIPFLTAGAALLGGLIGALARFYSADPKPDPRTIVGGTLIGIVVFAAYAVGINLLPVTPKVTVGAALVFAVSALAGWWGPKAIRIPGLS